MCIRDRFKVDNKIIKKDDFITIDGGSGNVFEGKIPTIAVSYTHLDVYKRQSMDRIIKINLELFERNVDLINNNIIDRDSIVRNIKNFIFQRLRYLLLEKGYKYDIIDAVLDVYKRQHWQSKRVG